MNIIDKLVPTLLREENPDFSKLLSLIEDKISPTGASLNILQQNKEVSLIKLVINCLTIC